MSRHTKCQKAMQTAEWYLDNSVDSITSVLEWIRFLMRGWRQQETLNSSGENTEVKSSKNVETECVP